MKKLLSYFAIISLIATNSSTIVSCNEAISDKSSKDIFNKYKNDTINNLKDYLLTNNNGQEKDMLYQTIEFVHDLTIDKNLWEFDSKDIFYYFYNGYYYEYDDIKNDEISKEDIIINIKNDKTAQDQLTNFQKLFSTFGNISYSLHNDLIISSNSHLYEFINGIFWEIKD